MMVGLKVVPYELDDGGIETEGWRASDARSICVQDFDHLVGLYLARRSATTEQGNGEDSVSVAWERHT